MIEKRSPIREETRWMDSQIIRIFIAHPDATMKVAALLLSLHYQRIYRAAHRLSKDRRKLDGNSV